MSDEIEEPTTVQLSKRQITYVNEGQEIPIFYANNVELFATSWDVRFRFGLIQGADANALSVKNQVSVMMSIEHARTFMKVLRKNIEKWDELNATKKG